LSFDLPNPFPSTISGKISTSCEWPQAIVTVGKLSAGLARAYFPAYSVSVAGFVELRDESQKSDRFVLRLERIEGNRMVDKPQRVRLSIRRGMAPPAGAFVEAKAQLNPPLQPGRTVACSRRILTFR
jgi:hypothetical protein